MIKYLFLFVLAFGLRAAPLPLPSVLVTIKPIHSLVARLMQGRGQPHLLLSGFQSPHHITLSPSQRNALEKATLVIWIGPSFEIFLAPWMKGAHSSQKLTLLEQPGLILLPQACTHTERSHNHIMDGHLWMDPQNTILLVRSITKKLLTHDPQGKAIYEKNLEELEADLRVLDQEIKEILKPCHRQSFAVTHQAYVYFVKRFGLQKPTTVLSHPEKGGTCPHDLFELACFLKQHPGGCVFFEPQLLDITSPLKDFILKRGGRVAEIDPLGACDPPGPNLYPHMLKRCAKALRDNLSPQPSLKESAHATTQNP